MIRTVIAVLGILAGPFAGPAGATAVAGSDDYCAVTLPAQTVVCAASSALLAAAPAHTDSTQFLIARLYDKANYDTSGGYLNVYAGADCTASTSNVDYSLSDLSTWSNRVSSFQSFGTCATRLWSSANFSGTTYPGSGYSANSTYVGAAFNDRARSAQFS